MPDGSLQLVCKPNVFDRDSAVYAEVRAGQTLAQMLGGGISHTALVTINGDVVPRELWARVRPKTGTQIHVLLLPQGGSARKWIATVLMVVITVLTYGATAGWFATAGGMFAAGSASAAFLAAGIGIVGSLMVSSLVAPPSPKGLGAAGDPFQQLNQITGTSNQVNPYGVIPCVVGTYRFYPCHAALPYTEISGDQQYLRMLLDLGYGALTVSDLKIGETALSSYDDVDYEITTSPTLFTQDVYELSVATALNDAGSTDSRTTQASTEEISLDLIFNQGLFGIDDHNNTLAATVGFGIQYQDVNGGAWQYATAATGLQVSNGAIVSNGAGAFNITSGARKTLRCGIRWTVPTGQYNVKVVRGAALWGNAVAQGRIGDCVWSVLRSVSHSNPSTTGTLKLAVRIKATDQLNGVVQNLSVLASQNVRTWNKATQAFGAAGPTQNPAWIYAWLMTQCPAVARRLPDNRMDWDGIADWAAECEAKGYVTSFVMDSGRAFADIIRDVLAAGRASFGFRNGLYSAVRDIPQTVPVQMFTPANSWGFSYSRAFADLPHGLRCKFVNPQAGYKQDYVNVYAPGYSAANATRFEELDLGPVVDPDAAWRLGMYHLAVIWNRPTQYVFNADIEHMVCERGDLVSVAHDITGWGEAWGRIVAIGAQSVTLDGPVTLAAGKTYRLRARTASDTQVTATVTSAAGETATLALDADLAASVGDLWVLGAVNTEIAALIVRQIEPDSDFNAKLTCVDAAPVVWTADAGTPPPFVSNITGDIFCAPPDPPSVDIVASDQRLSPPDDGGITRPGTNLGVGGGVGGGILRPGGGGNRRTGVSAL